MGGEILLSLNITLISLMALILLSKEYTEEHCLLAVLLGQLSLFPDTLSIQAFALLRSVFHKNNGACAGNVAPSTDETERQQGARAENHRSAK